MKLLKTPFHGNRPSGDKIRLLWLTWD